MHEQPPEQAWKELYKVTVELAEPGRKVDVTDQQGLLASTVEFESIGVEDGETLAKGIFLFYFIVYPYVMSCPAFFIFVLVFKCFYRKTRPSLVNISTLKDIFNGKLKSSNL